MAVVHAPRPLTGAVLLLFVSAAWGSAFPLMKDLIHRLPVEDLLAERYLIAAVTLWLIRPRSLRGLARSTWLNGIMLGVLFGVGQTAQAMALTELPSSVSGFAVGCNVIITPVMALFLFKVKVPMRVWVGVVLALAGMTMFTLLKGVEDNEFSLLALAGTLTAAALYSGHTLLLARMTRSRSHEYNPYSITVIQLGTIGVLTGILALPGGISVPGSATDWAILAHLSVVSCALGFLARSFGQAHVPAVPSAVLMSSQPLWVAAIAVVFFAEPLGWSLFVGGGLMAAAMLLAVPSKGSPSGATPSSEVPPSGPPPAVNRRLLELSKQRLADLRVKREDPLKFDAEPLPVLTGSACVDVVDCPWNVARLKATREPDVERLIDRATGILHTRNPSPSVPDGCCQSVTIVGRCLCALMAEAEEKRSPMLAWFRTP